MPAGEARDGRFPGPSLIPHLNAIQAEHGWLARVELERLAREMKRPLYEIQGLVSFYPHYRTEGPAPVVQVSLCHDLSCWLHDGEAAIAAALARYGDDAEVELREVSCLGRCELAPACAVNEHPCGMGQLDDIVSAARSGTLQEAPAVRFAPALAWPNDPYDPSDSFDGNGAQSGDGRYRLLRRALTGELTPEAIVAALNDAGLRGMGGAGFPTGRKWDLVRAQPGPVKYAICNADESEPGTFKDRQVLAEQPHLVLEGMLLGMLVVGASQGTVFVRHEYGPETTVVRREIEALQAAGLLGDDVLGSGRTLLLDVFVSPGGYILGEESALLECMEGHRGEPRNKPPFPGVSGLWGCPTLINSVETFADVPVIVERGADWWKQQGVNGCTGLKFISVSGDVERPGVYCVPMGTTVGDLLDQAGGVAGGRELLAVQPGGASSNFVGPDRLDTPLDFAALQEAGTMLGSGALVVVAEGTDLLAAATNVLRFFRNESCGKCVPCRVGSTKAHDILTAHLAAGGGAADVDDRITDLEETLRLTSICGLGQVALGPVVSVVRLERGRAPVAPDVLPQAGRASASEEL